MLLFLIGVVKVLPCKEVVVLRVPFFLIGGVIGLPFEEGLQCFPASVPMSLRVARSRVGFKARSLEHEV